MWHLIRILIITFLSLQISEATIEFTKSTGLRCNQCHDGKPRAGSVPKLRYKAIAHMTRLINISGYVPRYNYRELSHLSKMIEENQKGGGARVKVVLGGLDSTPSEAIPVEELEKQKAEEKAKQATKKVVVKKKIARPVLSGKTKIVKLDLPDEEEDKKSKEEKIEEARLEKKLAIKHVKMKGGKTFILRRKKTVDLNPYDWREDWGLDEYQ